MALTDLTVTRRNVVALDFTATTLIPGTSGNVMYNYSVNKPYLHIAADGGDAWPDSAGPPSYPERYSFLYINGSGQEFGAYYDFEVRGSYGGNPSALTRDYSQFIITTTGPAGSNLSYPVGGQYIRFHKAITANLGAVVLNSPKFPVDGQVYYPTGYEGIRGGGDYFQPNYNIGGTANTIGILANNPADSSVRVFTMSDGTEYKAFVTESGFSYRQNQAVTLSDASFNYTMLDSTPDALTGNSVWMSKWTAQATGSAFAQTNYRIVLSDAADDAIFQAANDYNFADYRMIRGNYEQFVYVIVSSSVFPLRSQTAFVFAKDFSWYDRIDITANGQLSFGLYFQDVDGNHFLVGTHVSAGSEAFQTAGAVVTPPAGGGNSDSLTLRVWGYSLDGHDNYVLRVGETASLIYDLTTGQWSHWATEGQNWWRAVCGQNWTGMSTTTIARAFGSDVVAGDDTTGVLWILDPTTGRDDLTTTGSQSYTRKVIGGINANGRDSAPCNAVELTCALGAPTQTGAALTLRFSDDLGQTWVNAGSLAMTSADYSQVIEWRGLGTINAPGRIFEISDDGATIRIGKANMR